MILLYMHIIVLWSYLTPSLLPTQPPPPDVTAVPKHSHHSFRALYLSIRTSHMSGNKWYLSSLCPFPSSLFPLFSTLPPHSADQGFHGLVHLSPKPCSMKMGGSHSGKLSPDRLTLQCIPTLMDPEGEDC